MQSEHGSWFYRKANRNMVVETAEPVPENPDFCCTGLITRDACHRLGERMAGSPYGHYLMQITAGE